MERIEQLPRSRGPGANKYKSLIEKIKAAEPGYYRVDHREFGTGYVNVKNGLRYHAGRLGFKVTEINSEIYITIPEDK